MRGVIRVSRVSEDTWGSLSLAITHHEVNIDDKKLD
jgi:hypothetical protein